MGLASLDSALSGLKVYQQQLDVVSNNVANVGTEGYTRKILPQSSQVVQGKSIGVLGETIVRNVDLRIQRDLWTQVSSVNFYDVQNTYLSRIDQFHGDPSAETSIASSVSKLQDTFAALANAPDDQFSLTDVVDQAKNTAKKINDLSDYITTLRNDAQSEADVTVTSINDLLGQIAELNSQIRFAQAGGRTTAAVEDKRDQAVSNLAAKIDISTYKRGDGVLVVQTRQGVELASDRATPLVFRPTPLSPTTAYPDTSAGIYVGDPVKNTNAIDITQAGLGGQLGGLIELRDYAFPKQMAQLDELAHKLATRFDQQGLKLFTDSAGGIPADTPPDPSTDPPTSVPYVGFSSKIQVNDLVLNDNSLIQKGTYGGSLATGATDVVRRVIQYTFGNVNYQTATNEDAATSVDIQAAATGGTTLQDWLGLRAQSTLTSSADLSNYASVADIVTAGGNSVFGTAPNETDTFTLRFDDPDIGSGPYDINVDLRNVPTSGSGAAQDLVNYITSDANWANVVADFGASASVGANGELVLKSGGDIEVSASATQPMSDTGFAFVGLGPGKAEAQDPYFDVQVGNAKQQRITINPGDTETDLLAKLNAVDGLSAQIDANGFLSLRPGNSSTDPDFGGDIKIIGGPFETSAATLGGTAAGRSSLNDGVNIVNALFGTYQDLGGGVYEGYSPIVDVPYQSETQAGSGKYVAFRENYLGPQADTQTEITNTLTLKDFSQKIVNEASQELALVQSRKDDESTLKDLLNQKFLDDSGVNVDEELGHLVTVQTAYSAAARVISAVDDIFKELLSVV